MPPPPAEIWPAYGVDVGGAWRSSDDNLVFVGRVHGGISYVADFNFWNFEAFLGTNAFRQYLAGGLVSFNSTGTGLGAYGGPGVDFDGRFVMTAGVSFSVVSAEAQVTFGDDTTAFVGGMLRIPLGSIVHMLTRPRPKEAAPK